MKIMIADDHALLREGIQSLLKKIADGIEVLEAQNSQEILAQSKAGDIDLLLLDLNMPGIGNVAAVERMCTTMPSTAIVVLSANESTHVIRGCMDAGAMGFIPKSTPNPIIMNAIRLVLSGDRYVPFSHLNQINRLDIVDKVTPRQMEVWKFLAVGLSNKEIGRELNLTEGTIKQHISALFKKLGIRSRAEAIQKAKEMWD